MSDGERTGNAGKIRITLFVALHSDASMFVIERLQRALERYESSPFDLEIVNVSAEPRRVLCHSILVTPTLLAAEFDQRLVGELRNATVLDHFLQMLLALRADRS